MKFFFDYEKPELAAIFDPSFRATQIYKSVYQRSFDDFDLMTDLPKSFRAALAEEWDIKLPAVHRRFDSIDGTRRYLVALSDDDRSEERRVGKRVDLGGRSVIKKKRRRERTIALN